MPLTPHGTTVVFTKSGFTGRLRSVDGPALSCDSLDSSYLGSPYRVREFTPGMLNSGELALEVLFDPDKLYSQHQFSDAYHVRGWSDAASELDTVTVTFPPQAGQSTGATTSGTGFVTNFQATGKLGELMMATLTFQVSGVWTYTAGA